MTTRFTWLARGGKTRQVTLGELGGLLWKRGRTGSTGRPSPWDRLVSELRQAGYLSAEDDLAELLGSYLVTDALRGVHLPATAATPPGTGKLGQPLPDELVSRLWRLAPEVGYWPRGGFLQATSSSSAPLRSAQALERYGIKVLIHAQVGPSKRGAPIPGQAVLRAWRRISPPLIILLSPLFALMWALTPAAGRGRQRRLTGPGHRQTGSELRQWLVRGVCLAIPGTAVAAWYVIWAIHLPPHGPAGRWIALLLAGAFGIQNLITLQLVILSSAMDGSNKARQPATRPIRYLATNSIAVLTVYCIVNAPLAICTAAASALT